jgi:hypothetical protein
MDRDTLALLFLLVIVVAIVLSPPGPGTPRRIKVPL